MHHAHVIFPPIAPSSHPPPVSPLMALTCAISGITIVGGMLQLGTETPLWLAAGAVGASAVNLVGGFLITQKMLDMFKRPDDPAEHHHYYYLPPVVLGSGLGVAALAGGASPALISTVALASGLGCIGGISCLSQQDTARMGVTVGVGGTGLGIAAALATMSMAGQLDGEVMAQFLGFTALGSAAGYGVATRVGPTQLPQAVAGFGGFGGLAATLTSVGDFMVNDPSAMTNFHASSLYVGAWMGAITVTGSLVAAGKLAEVRYYHSLSYTNWYTICRVLPSCTILYPPVPYMLLM